MTHELVRSMDQSRRKCADCGSLFALKPTKRQAAGSTRAEMRVVPRDWLHKHVCRGEVPKRFR